MLPEMRQLAELSEETFSKILGVDVDWAAQKGKSFNDVLTRDGQRLYDIIDFNSLGLTIEHTQKCAKNGKDVVTNGQILFRDMDKEYLKDFIRKLDDTSNWKNLDVESAFDGKVMRDFRSWKDKADKLLRTHHCCKMPKRLPWYI